MAIYISDANGNLTKYAGGAVGNDAIIAEINSKLNTNAIVRYPVSKFVSTDGLTWYTIYNDGWKECGGALGSAGSFGTRSIDLPVTFSNVYYSLCLTGVWYDSSGSGSCVTNKTQSSISIYSTNADNKATYYACGY